MSDDQFRESAEMSGDERLTDSSGLPAPFAALWESAWQAHVFLATAWDDYQALFLRDPKSIEIMNWFAPSFFRHCQEALLDDVLLRIARLTDRSSTNGRANLSATRLLEEARGVVPDTLVADLLNELSQLNARIGAISEHRNKRIAHSDMHASLGDRAIPPVTAKVIQEAIREISSVFHRLDQALNRPSSILFGPAIRSGGAEQLLHALSTLRDYEEERDEETGKFKRC